jgi:hypothetical protein
LRALIKHRRFAELALGTPPAANKLVNGGHRGPFRFLQLRAQSGKKC